MGKIAIVSQTCKDLAASIGGDSKNPSIKIEATDVYFTVSELFAHFSKVSGAIGAECVVHTHQLSAALRGLQKDPIITGKNFGGPGMENQQLTIKAGRRLVELPTKPVDSYPLTQDYLKHLGEKFSKDSFIIPGAYIAEMLKVLSEGAEPPDEQYEHTSLIFIQIEKVDDNSIGMRGYLYTNKRFTMTNFVVVDNCKMPKVFDDFGGFLISRKYTGIFKILEKTADMTAFNFHIDSPDSSSAWCEYPTVDIYIPLIPAYDISPEVSKGLITNLVQGELREAWNELPGGAEGNAVRDSFIVIPESWEATLSAASDVLDSKHPIIITLEKNSLVVESVVASSTKFKESMPCVYNEERVEFRIFLDVLRNAKGTHILPLEVGENQIGYLCVAHNIDTFEGVYLNVILCD